MRRHGPRCAPAPLPALARAGSLALIAFLANAAAALAADPTASPPGGDVRTNPAAPGLVGDPLFAVLGVIVIGLLAVVVTLTAVRLTTRR
jgi:hypothetical protein